MAQENNDTAQDKPSALKQAFQWAAAIAAPFSCEAPQRAYDQAGQAYDYVKTWIGAHRAPKLT